MARKKIFISHAAPDTYIVPLLERLLEVHGHQAWFAKADLRAGDLFHEKIGQELASSDVLLMVVSRNTLSSPWVTTEVAKFQALKPHGLVIPFVLDDSPIEDLDRISPGLSSVHAIRSRDCLLEGFEKLFAALEIDFLSLGELRNRRTGSDRRRRDRRTATVLQRLSMGLLVAYTRHTGSAVAASRSLAVGDIEALREPVLRELSRYSYRGLRDRCAVPAERVLAHALEHVKTEMAKEHGLDAVEVLRDVATYVNEHYEVAMIERRGTQRRRTD